MNVSTCEREHVCTGLWFRGLSAAFQTLMTVRARNVPGHRKAFPTTPAGFMLCSVHVVQRLSDGNLDKCILCTSSQRPLRLLEGSLHVSCVRCHSTDVHQSSEKSSTHIIRSECKNRTSIKAAINLQRSVEAHAEQAVRKRLDTIGA